MIPWLLVFLSIIISDWVVDVYSKCGHTHKIKHYVLLTTARNYTVSSVTQNYAFRVYNVVALVIEMLSVQ